jgi:hypothetical protein
MLTGTPLDLTAFGSALRAVGVLYWLLAIIALGAALWWTPRWFGKLAAALVVMGAFSYLPITHWLALREARAQQRAAFEHFEARCRDAGERIHRRETGVEGVLLMKIRSHVDVDSQFTPDDVYGSDNADDDYIKSFLRVVAGTHLVREVNVERYRQGYTWVEATDPKDGKLYRFSLVGDVERLRSDETWAQAKKNIGSDVGREVYGLVLKRQPIDKPTARYGVNWADTSTREDRTQWVAGGVIQVIDLRTQEVIAERKGFMWDDGMGSRAGGRSPWLFAQRHACPAFPERGPGDPRRERTRREGIEFVTKVLEPKAKE